MEGLLDGWRRRVEAMRQARRAYAKALHIDPAQPGAWQDAAFAYHHEARVGHSVGDTRLPAHLPALPALVPAHLPVACCPLSLLLLLQHCR